MVLQKIKNVRNFRILLKFLKTCDSIESAVAEVTALFYVMGERKDERTIIRQNKKNQ